VHIDNRDRVSEAKFGPLIMEPGFDLARNLLDHTRLMEANVAQTGDGTPSLMPDNVIDIVRQSASDLTNSVTFSGRETRAGFDDGGTAPVTAL